MYQALQPTSFQIARKEYRVVLKILPIHTTVVGRCSERSLLVLVEKVIDYVAILKGRVILASLMSKIACLSQARVQIENYEKKERSDASVKGLPSTDFLRTNICVFNFDIMPWTHGPII